MATYSIKDLAQITEGRVIGNADYIINNILIDSRSTSISVNSLFFAIIGKQHNGHFFIDELYNRGIRAFVVSESGILIDKYPGAGFIQVKDTISALHKLTHHHRNHHTAKIIGITGSNGKTIVKEWLYHCLSDQYSITRSPKSYNSQIGVPLSLWLIDKETELGIIEAGISMPGEMAKLEKIIEPDIGIFTNIGEAHQENFISVEQKITEKLKLFYRCNLLIYCSDHQKIHNHIVSSPELEKVEKFTWAVTEKANVHIHSIKKTGNHTTFSVAFKELNIEFTIPFIDSASFENAMHCIALMLYMNFESSVIISKMSELPPIAMRLEQKNAINNCTLINDSYNSDLNSLSIALDVLNLQHQHKKKTLILSDIFQSGRKQNELYKAVATMIKEKGVTRLIGIGNTISRHASLFTIPSSFYESSEFFIKDVEQVDFSDEAILLKGSRQFEFEKIAALLELKKHSTRIEINLSALAHNLNYFRSLLNPATKTMVMVKAFSYGSGRHEIAGILQFQRVHYLGVAIADEGVSLRNAGINLPIIVMNPEPESFDTIIEHKLEPEIYGSGILELFYKAVIKNQEINYPVHIKIDTGMHRLGFLAEETDDLCKKLLQFKNLNVRSVFSHLAGSDEEEFDNFTREQITLFKNTSDKIIRAIGYPLIRHILNTSGIERFPDAQFDMVRLGIGLYGISTVNQHVLRNVSTLKSTILQIKTVKTGETVGYSRKGKTSKTSLIAIVPIGYADGLNRKLGNGKGSFLLHGKLVPTIGNISMDMTMIDVTGTDAKEGDEVIVFGEGNPITSLARKLDTIPYEIITGVSERVKRVYYYE